MQTQSKVNEIASLLRARCSLLSITTTEEGRAMPLLIEAAGLARYGVYLWDCANGWQDASGARLSPRGEPMPQPEQGEEIEVTDAMPVAILRRIEQSADKALWILRDLHRWGDPITLRLLRSVARDLERRAPDRTIVLVSPSAELPQEIATQAVAISLPLPQRDEVAALLDQAIEALPASLRDKAVNGDRDRAIDAALGLSADEIANAYACSIVRRKCVDPVLVATEKKRLIGRAAGVEWIEPDPRGFDAIGGNEGVKRWARTRQPAFNSQRARAFGLPMPKGFLLVGPPGTGKSMTPKALATEWRLPLLRWDPGASLDKYVGGSEANTRNVFALAETMAPVILWIDEIEKGFGGMGEGPQGDGGVKQNQGGSFLTWMSEKRAPVFVIATANNIDRLPPEMLRKGRFDEIFFVDLPDREERAAVLVSAFAQYGRDAVGAALLETGEVSALLDRCEGWSGAEIASLVSEALYQAFADGEREITAADLVAAAAETVPLSETTREPIARLRKWAQGRTRPANLRQRLAPADPGGRKLDV